MKIQEAIKTHSYVRRPSWDKDSAFCYHQARTGPYKDLVDCDYFTVLEDGFLTFSTSAPDLYAEEILADDYEVLNVSSEVLNQALERTKEVSDTSSCCGKGCCD